LKTVDYCFFELIKNRIMMLKSRKLFVELPIELHLKIEAIIVGINW